jgi:AAA15 family ATPase/GTPase
MRVFLQKMSFSGIKNIKNEITIDFSNKKIGKDLEYTKVKAIYGPNGAGKTAVVDAVKIYQALTTEKTQLYNKAFRAELLETMNKISNKIHLSFTAIIIDDEFRETNKIQHDIELTAKDKDVMLSYESLKRYKNINSDVVLMSITQQNNLVTFNKVGQEKVINHEVNQRSMIDLYRGYIKSLHEKKVPWKKLTKHDQNDFVFFSDFIGFTNALYIISEDADDHGYYFTERKFNNFGETYLEENTKTNFSVYDEIVRVDEVEKYNDFYQKIENFIKVFKTDLIKINLEEKSINSNEIKMEKYFNYGDYKVHMEFESAGIKKLVKLYAAIHNAVQGGITIIDEFDANINDVYLNKLIEYVIYHGQGQLMFTTHNTSPMETLRNHKRSIDFINESGELVNWVINGNASPVKMYHNGAIDGLPFNIDSFDFIGLFDE